ncbi:MAG TPA: hypothetical protein VL971_02870 [Rhizomicrobium sp.]|nr:hypothetical protein [Rhizomicrobium sp.]
MTPLTEWRDFYVTVGTASGAIVGAAFVVASLTSGQEKRELGIRGFITPTAVHLAGVMIASAVMIVPAPTVLFLSAFFGLGGLAGMAYGGLVIARIRSLTLDLPDRFWYCCAAPLSYAAMAVSAWAIWTGAWFALPLLAASLVALLVTGMRNLWDMATFMILSAAKPPKEQLQPHDSIDH